MCERDRPAIIVSSAANKINANGINCITDRNGSIPTNASKVMDVVKTAAMGLSNCPKFKFPSK